MNKMRSMYTAMLGMALAGTNINENFNSSSEVIVVPKNKPVPKGCREYFFSSTGDIYYKNDGLYEYKCIALNEKSARKKFNKYVSQQFKPV